MVLCLMIMRIRGRPELQMRKIKQKFMLTQVRGFPKKTASLSCVLLPFLREKFRVNMSLTEETSSVDEVQRVLKQKLNFEVILLDANTSLTNKVSLVSAVYLELFSDCFHQTVSRPPHK